LILLFGDRIFAKKNGGAELGHAGTLHYYYLSVQTARQTLILRQIYFGPNKYMWVENFSTRKRWIKTKRKWFGTLLYQDFDRKKDKINNKQ